MTTLQIVQFINATLIILMLWKGFWKSSYTTILYNIAVFISLYLFSIGEYNYCLLTITTANVLSTLRAMLHKQRDKLLKV